MRQQLTEYLTPPELAKRWRVDAAKVLQLIAAGEIPGAFDVSSPGSRRARWRIPMSAVVAFESARAARPRVKRPRRRKRKSTGVVQYF